MSGMVQGVGYRSFAVRHGHSLNLSGYARNTGDGRVEVEAEGEQADVERFISLLKDGPSAAEVSDVQVEWKKILGEATSFTVRF